MIKANIFISLVTGGLLLTTPASQASNDQGAADRIIPTGKYYHEQLKQEFNYAEVKVVDSGKTLMINAYDHCWFSGKDSEPTGEILDPIKEALKDPNLTKVVLDSRRTIVYIYRQLAGLIAANPSIKTFEMPTFVGSLHRMNTQIKPSFQDYFKDNQGLTIIAGEDKPQFGDVKITFVIP